MSRTRDRAPLERVLFARIMFFLAAAGLHGEVGALEVLNLTPDAGLSSAPGFGTDIIRTVNDGFDYNPLDPTATLPNQIHPNNFHGDEGPGLDVNLYYNLDSAVTLESGQSLAVDLYGRSECCFDRDDDYDIELYNGDWSTPITVIAGQGIVDAAPYHNRTTYEMVGATFDRFRVVAHDSNGLGDNNLFTLQEIRAAVIDDQFTSLAVSRETGGLTLLNNTAANRDILGYSIKSDLGALDQAGWTSIAGNYDGSATGDGSVDANDTWIVLTGAGVYTDLSETELGGPGPRDGGTLTSGVGVDLGAAWIQNPSEDLRMTLLLTDGTIENVPVFFTGNNDEAFQRSDLNFDGTIDALDWEEYIAVALTDVSGLSPAAAYQAGDLNGDGLNNIRDTDVFIGDYETVNGQGSFADMLRSVPEPGTFALLALGAIAFGLRKFRRPAAGLPLLLVAVVALHAGTAQAIDYTWTGTAGDGNWSNVANWDANGVPVDDNLDSNGLSLAGLDDRIIFSAASLPTGNIPDIGGRNAGGTHTPIIDVHSGGVLSLTTGVGEIGGYITNAQGVTRTLFFVGDGVGGGSEDVTLNISHTGELIRHDQQSTHNFAINSDGTLNFDAGVQFSSELSQNNRPRYATMAIAGGAVNINGAVTNLSVADPLSVNNFVDFTTPGGSFTAQFGGDFADLDAVQNATGGDTTSFRSTTFNLRTMDNGDGSFTVTSTEDPVVLSLVVNTMTGATRMVNTTPFAIDINAYEINSPGGALDPVGWLSFSDQNLDPVGGGDDPGETWDEAGGVSSNALLEGFLLGHTSLSSSSSLTLGAAFDETVFGAGLDGDLTFTYRDTGGALRSGLIEYVDDTVVDGDFDNNGVWDEADIDALVAEIAVMSTDLAFDMNGDGMITRADITDNNVGWLAVGGANNVDATGGNPFLEGDANLDGSVDVSDFNAWNGAKFSNVAAWSAGDFDATGSVDVSDFNVWNGKKFTSSQDGVSVVPEPTTAWLFVLGMSWLVSLARSDKGVRFMNRGSLSPWRASGMILLLAVCGTSVARAGVTNDREYWFGEDSLEGASQDALIGSNNTLPLGAGTTADSKGPTGAFLDLVVTGGPTYENVGPTGLIRPGAAPGEFAARFNGTTSYLETSFPLNRPDELAALIAAGNGGNYPLNYDGIVGRGLQAWVYPDQAGLGAGAWQSIVFDSIISGGPAITADGKWTQFNSQHADGSDGVAPVPASIDVPGGDQWYHVMHHNYPVSGDNFTSVLYVNGVAVSANNDAIPVGQTTAGGRSGLLIVGAAEYGGVEPVIANHFQGVVDDLEMYVFGDNTDLGGQDWGTFNLFADNAWIANEIATDPNLNGTLQMGDVNRDGTIDNGDVDAFVAGWLREKRFDGAHVTATAGDWETWGWGDLNLDGIVELDDAFLLHEALVVNGQGGLDFSRLVPEPSGWVLCVMAVASVLRRRRPGVRQFRIEL